MSNVPYGPSPLVTSFKEVTYYQRFKLIQEIVDSMFEGTTDSRIAADCSDIRVVCNRYFRDHAPKRGD